MVRVVLKPQQGIKVGSSNKYLFDPAISQAYDDLAKDWAIKTDGLVESEDYSSKAYAIGGTGTETNNSKYYSEQAGISATNASTSETNAGISATTATTKAGEASASATIATTQAGIATTKANNASNSATTATTQAGIATSKAGEAATSATNAGISETNAGNSATSASNSANSASASASLAQNWANKTDGTVDGVEYSAKYYAEQAAQQVIPSQTGHSGEYLTTDGSSMSWNAVDSLPSQTGQSGKYLTTDGTDASWANVDALPSQTGQSGKYLTTDGSSASWATLSVNPDNISINKNSSDQLQAIGLINKNTAAGATNPIYDWEGTLAEYEAQNVETLHPEWLCFITDDNSSGVNVYTKTEVNNLLADKVDTDYSNASYIPAKTDLSNMNASATAKNTIVSWGMPNYSAAVSKSLANGSISGKGYLLFTTKQNVGTCNITIGSTVFAIGSNYNTLDILFVPVDNNSYACSDWSIINSLVYVPLKGV